MAECFVAMGFGKKTDFATGRTLDLDKTYRNVIKPVVEECGLTCVRADEILHSGTIDVPMYEHLMRAELVIADVSTANPNALYELGVRHALKPYATIVMAEEQQKYPFDLNHTAVTHYRHMGEDIGYDEVTRVRGVLRGLVQEVLAKLASTPPVDSPVYTYLPTLEPPRAGDRTEPTTLAAGASTAAVRDLEALAPTLSALRGQAEAAMDKGDVSTAAALFRSLRAARTPGAERTLDDDSVTQRLALATYKSKQPDEATALAEARTLLEELAPDTSNDTETLGLYGAVRKRQWDATKDQAHLDAAIRAYERGFYLRHDHYNGINFAFLLNVRASVSPPAEAVADFVTASRVRRDVLRIGQAQLESTPLPDTRKPTPAEIETRYWLLATLAEAQLGLGDAAASDALLKQAKALGPLGWMVDSTKDQLERLRGLVASSPLRFLSE